METALSPIGMMLLQEVGFDLVSFWKDTGDATKAVIAIFLLALLVFAVWKMLGRKRERPE